VLPTTCGAPYAPDDRIAICDDLMLRDVQYAPPEPCQSGIASRVGPRAVLVAGAVDLNDEAHLGARKVHDVRTDDELAPKPEARFGAGEAAPEGLFAARRREAHGASALFEERGVSGRNECTSEHEHLRETGADARRAKTRSAASVTRRGAGGPERSPLAARKVRVRSSARICAGASGVMTPLQACRRSPASEHRTRPARRPSSIHAQAAGRAWIRRRTRVADAWVEAHKYDPTTGRWTTKDGAGLGGGFNVYAYASNTPVNLVDPSGRNAVPGSALMTGLFSPGDVQALYAGSAEAHYDAQREASAGNYFRAALHLSAAIGLFETGLLGEALLPRRRATPADMAMMLPLGGVVSCPGAPPGIRRNRHTL
jgi:hypothetical protein